jgi:NAD+ synthase (glutamine-hydrolysing)
VKAGADFVITPELAVCGYPPMDLVFRSGFIAAAERHVNALAVDTGKVPLIVGTVEPNTARHGRPCRNSAVVLQNGRRVATAHKSLLPTYDVFDEGRYFEPWREPKQNVVEHAGVRIGVVICEDGWNDDTLGAGRSARHGDGHRFDGAHHARDPCCNLCSDHRARLGVRRGHIGRRQGCRMH